MPRTTPFEALIAVSVACATRRTRPVTLCIRPPTRPLPCRRLRYPVTIVIPLRCTPPTFSRSNWPAFVGNSFRSLSLDLPHSAVSARHVMQGQSAPSYPSLRRPYYHPDLPTLSRSPYRSVRRRLATASLLYYLFFCHPGLVSSNISPAAPSLRSDSTTTPVHGLPAFLPTYL